MINSTIWFSLTPFEFFSLKIPIYPSDKLLIYFKIPIRQIFKSYFEPIRHKLDSPKKKSWRLIISVLPWGCIGINHALRFWWRKLWPRPLTLHGNDCIIILIGMQMCSSVHSELPLRIPRKSHYYNNIRQKLIKRFIICQTHRASAHKQITKSNTTYYKTSHAHLWESNVVPAEQIMPLLNLRYIVYGTLQCCI